MRTRVKYCGMVRPHDVDAAVAIGADAVGFVFYSRSPRLLDVETALALRRRLPSWVSAVGLFVNEQAAVIESIVHAVGLDVIQLHGDETPADARALATPWWKAIRIDASGAVGRGIGGVAGGGIGGVAGKGGAAAAEGGAEAAGEPPQRAILRSLAAFHDAEFCLLDSASAGYGGSGKTFDWTVVPPDVGRRVIMSGGLDAGNVGAAIASVRPFGVDTSSGIQGRNPREKDLGRMEQFMEAVRRADDPTASTKQ